MDFSPIADTSIVDLVLLFAEQMSGENSPDAPDNVFKKLEDEGFSKRQLDYAYSLVMKQMMYPAKKRTVRIFSEGELGNFSPEAASILIRLNRLGIIGDEQIEVILMRAALTPNEKLSEDELKMIIAMMLGGNNPDLPDGFFVPEDENKIH